MHLEILYLICIFIYVSLIVYLYIYIYICIYNVLNVKGIKEFINLMNLKQKMLYNTIYLLLMKSSFSIISEIDKCSANLLNSLFHIFCIVGGSKYILFFNVVKEKIHHPDDDHGNSLSSKITFTIPAVILLHSWISKISRTKVCTHTRIKEYKIRSCNLYSG